MLIGAAVLLVGCAGTPELPTPAGGAPAGNPTPTAPALPAATAAPTATSGISGPIVGTSVPGGGPITSPPLRDITPTNPLTPGPPMTPGPDGVVTVQMNDTGRTVHLHVGDRLQLALATSYDWTVTVRDPSVLAVNNPGTPGPGQATYQAAAAGQTVLQADGSPACRNATPPCGMPDRQVLLTIIVQ